MDRVISLLGLEFPSTKARNLVMKSCIDKRQSTKTFFPHHRDSMWLLKQKQQMKTSTSNEDDDTITTVLSGGDGDLSFTSNSSSSSNDRCVTFAEPLVTKVYTREFTTREDRVKLFYTDQEYLDFRLEAYCGISRSRLVSFADELVTEVREIPRVQDPKQFYYSPLELQDFLNEFIASLEKSTQEEKC